MNTIVTEAPKMYETENDISQKHRSELNALMNQRLADAIDLQMQMKQSHWNVKGPSFIGLHELFDKVDFFGSTKTAPVQEQNYGDN